MTHLKTTSERNVFTISDASMFPFAKKKFMNTKGISLENLNRLANPDVERSQELSRLKSNSDDKLYNRKCLLLKYNKETESTMPVSKTERKNVKFFEQLRISRPEGKAYDNTLFQYDEDYSNLKNAVGLWRFGKKGRELGHLGDVTDVKYVGNNVLLLTDMFNNRLQTLDTNGKLLNTCDLENIYPVCATLTKERQVVLTSHVQKCIMLLSKEGTLMNMYRQGSFTSPFGISEDPFSGYFAVTDQQGNSLTLLDKQFNIVLEINPTNDKSNCSFRCPRHVIFSPTGLIFVADSGNHSLKAFDKNGILVTNIGTYGRDAGYLRSPYGICIDHSGNVLIADHYNDRVACFDQRGQWIREALSSCHRLRHPQGLALTSDNKLCVSHGERKATEIAFFDITKANEIEQTFQSERL
ncbi:tripartite motif-containing protein 2-like isoform X2 [Octopus sinensis]|uniref:Tripartite motif-containing protein 2-like isoform X2 n=1 Tax=Octopus sinensis TaxID=2607531 RepID=A0A6P7T5X9_9MOLL|nr:tripartite motif-containing protein 2-like isoform X2 [Octopus sinensis]XP_029645667.1 tripartite motif-containing protein 2-like isoform X2 [Octopus sinensis]